MSEEIVAIDGSLLEGGGQILRMSLIISVLSNTPIRVYNIRAGRSKPGLMDQHLKGVELVGRICSAKIKGAELGSQEITFIPGQLRGGSYEAHIKTAGSISLLMQVAIPCLIFADVESKLKLHGGTNAEMAPQIEYVTEVFRPIMEKFGATFDFQLNRRGYFPRGGGEVEVYIKPVSKLTPVEMLQQGQITQLYGWSFVAGVVPLGVAHGMADGAIDELRRYHSNVDIERYKENTDMADGNCSGILLVAETNTGCVFGGSALGKREERANVTGARAAAEIIKTITNGACVDDHAQDQIIIFMGLADGVSRVKVGELTMHTKTAIYITEKLTKAKFNVTRDGHCSIIECYGGQDVFEIFLCEGLCVALNPNGQEVAAGTLDNQRTVFNVLTTQISKADTIKEVADLTPI
ncbi:RNA 3prime-terminal phosphate cyclase (RTC), insert domain [Popillia japonica]|uniref:RNA 3'-terminal phosphate cyclase n=1 Tax=Popillia japonica TaxID=7064 RepID=A0AAW1LLC2_POPJA